MTVEWLNLHTSVLDSPEFLGATPTQRATWLCLMRYAIGQENGGVIAGAAEWGDRKLQQMIRVTKDEINDVCDLWGFTAEGIVVKFYPVDKEAQVKRLRSQAKGAANAMHAAKRRRDGSGDGMVAGSATSASDGAAEGEGKEKGKEGGGREASPPPPALPAGTVGLIAADRQHVHAVLKELTLYDKPDGVDDWCRALDEIGSQSPEEDAAFIRWTVRSLRAAGQNVRYCRDVVHTAMPRAWGERGRAEWLRDQKPKRQEGAA